MTDATDLPINITDDGKPIGVHNHVFIGSDPYPRKCRDCDYLDEIVEVEVLSEQTLESLIIDNTLAVNKMTETLGDQVTLLLEIKGALEPMLDKLASNPMFRMMFPDKD